MKEYQTLRNVSSWAELRLTRWPFTKVVDLKIFQWQVFYQPVLFPFGSVSLWIFARRVVNVLTCTCEVEAAKYLICLGSSSTDQVHWSSTDLKLFSVQVEIAAHCQSENKCVCMTRIFIMGKYICVVGKVRTVGLVVWRTCRLVLFVWSSSAVCCPGV